MIPLENKYTKLYYNIIEAAKLSNFECYTENHHIIPRSLGGSDDDNNLVKLTAKQHFICHLLLTKMFTLKTYEYYKMIHAFCMMDWGTGNSKMYRYTSKVYEKERKEFSEYMSRKQSGEGNNQYGTKWAYNEKLKESGKFPKGSDLPEGWVWGRVLDWDEYFKNDDTKTYECIECNRLFISKRNRKYCDEKCSINFHNKKFKIEREKNKVQEIKEVKRKILKNNRVFFSSCVTCGNEFKSNSNRKKFCNTKCNNLYNFNYSKIVTLVKGDEIKEVKSQNVPAYKKWGWSIRH